MDLRVLKKIYMCITTSRMLVKTIVIITIIMNIDDITASKIITGNYLAEFLLIFVCFLYIMKKCIEITVISETFSIDRILACPQIKTYLYILVYTVHCVTE